jgi:cyclase
MKRLFVLTTLLAVGGLTLAAAAVQAPQGPSAAALAATKIEKVKENLYVITGSDASDQNVFSGGNTAVFITDAGVVVVDTKLPGWGPTVLQRIKSVTNKPITTIINTHTHGDHTGGNAAFPITVDSIVQENTRANMAKMDDYKGDKTKFLPKRTYKDKMTIGAGKDEVDLFYFGPGHTNGDTFVVFPALRTMHAGDMFAWKALPFIDTMNGGSAVSHPQTLSKAIAGIKNVDTVITGHTPVLGWNDLKEYADFSKDFVAWAQAEMKAGKTAEQAAAEYKVPPKYKGYTTSVGGFGGPMPNTQAVYDELKKK